MESQDYSSYFNDDAKLLLEMNYASYDINEATFTVWCQLTRDKILAIPDKYEPNCLTGTYDFKVTYTLNPITIVENKEKCIEFLEKCKSKSVVLKHEITCLYLYHEEIVAMPWQVLNYTAMPDTFFENDNAEHYWSSIHSSNINKIFPFAMRRRDKTNTGFSNMFQSTQIACYIKLSDYSLNKMQQYGELNRISLPGDNQVWVNEKIIKLMTSKTLWLHEINIYNLKLSCLPTMIEYWHYENEYFIVFEKAGSSFQQLYYLDCLIPEEIKLKQKSIITQLDEAGIHFIDAHMGNFTLDNDQVYAIDAESMIFKEDEKLAEELANIKINGVRYRGGKIEDLKLDSFQLHSKSNETRDFYKYLLHINFL